MQIFTDHAEGGCDSFWRNREACGERFWDMRAAGQNFQGNPHNLDRKTRELACINFA